MPQKRLTEQQTYDRLAELEKNKDYAGMARLVCDSFILEGNLTNADDLAMDKGFRRYFSDFGKRNNGMPNEENKDALKKILTEIQRIRVNSIIYAEREIEKWEKDIVQGKVDELVGLKEDNKTAHRVAHDIVMQKDPVGVNVRAGISALGAILQEVSSGSKGWEEALKTSRRGETEFSSYTERIESPVIAQLIKENGTADPAKAQKAMQMYESGAPKAKEYGFNVNTEVGFDTKLCDKIPEKYRIVESLKNADEYEDLIKTYEKKIYDADMINRAAINIGVESKNLGWQLKDETLGNKITESEKFIRMQEIIENLSNIGKNYKINIGGKKLPTNDISPNHIAKDITELKKLTRDIMPDLDKLGDKDLEGAQKAIKSIKDFADRSGRSLKQVTTGKETGTTSRNVKESLENINFIERQSSFRGIDLSEGKERRAEASRMRNSANAIDQVIIDAENAKIGVYGGSTKYDDAVNSLYSVSLAYNTYKEVFNSANSTPEEKVEAVSNLQTEVKKSAAAMEKYFERKRKQGKMNGNADEKTQKRINALKKALEITSMAVAQAEKDIPQIQNELDAGETMKESDLVNEFEIIEETSPYDEDEMDPINNAIDESVMYHEVRHSSNKQEVMINNAGADGAHLLAEYALQDPSTPITPTEQMSIRKAMLAMAYQDYFTQTDKGGKVVESLTKKDISAEDYNRFILNRVATSKDFIKATANINHDTIVEFMTDKKAPLKLIDKFSAERIKSSALNVPKSRPREATPELETAPTVKSPS